MIKVIRQLLSVFLLINILRCFVPSVSANYTFSDNFNDTSSIFSNWITLDNHVIPQLINDGIRTYARLYAGANNSFSYIGSQSLTQNITNVSFDLFVFDGGVTQGSGFMLTDKVPTTSQNPPNDYDQYSIGIWNIGDSYYLLSPLCDQDGGCGLSVYNRAVVEIPKNQWNTLQINYYTDGISISLNNFNRKFNYDSNPLPNGIFFGNSVLATNPQIWKDFLIDEFSITYGNPMTNQNNSFPYLSQKDPLWIDALYDNANSWAGSEKANIGRWGCAITSVAMVLKEYGIKMPNGDNANPDKINTWLISQPDGYIGNGLLNWLAISRLARDARDSGYADTDLEFVKSYGSPSDEISNGKYPIIDEGGHFVTLYDQNVDIYILNDPYDASRSSKLKTELIRSVNTYSPSNTDLSYIMLVSEEDTSIATKHNDNAVGEEYQEEIRDDIGGSSTGKFSVVYISKPSDGDYKLSINNAGTNSSIVKIYSYDKDGNVDKTEQTVPTGSSEWMFSYHGDGTDPEIIEQDSTPPVYLGTNSFSGWYNTPQTATFNFEDPNLPSDFVPPTCTISTEGKNKTCSINVALCDTYNNCKTFSLTSNPANIDLTPPTPIKHVWGIGMRPFSIVSWTPSKDTVKYVIEWGVEKNTLTNKIYVSEHWAWVPTPRTKQIYVMISAEDRAGNVSKPSKVEKINIHPHYWRW